MNKTDSLTIFVVLLRIICPLRLYRRSDGDAWGQTCGTDPSPQKLPKNKTLFVYFFFLFSTNVFAQKIGIKGGVHLTSVVSNTLIGQVIGFQPILNFHGGVVSEINISKKLLLQPQILFTTKGAKLALTPNELNIYYLEMPINVLYRFHNFKVGGGPYLGYALGGIATSGSNGIILTIGTGIKDTQRLDYGVNFTANYPFESGVFASVNYTVGLANISNNPNQSMTNAYFGIALGYMFGKD